MAIKLLFFGQCAKWMKCRELEIEAQRPQRLIDLLEKSALLSPLSEYKGIYKVSVNCEFGTLNTEVKDGDEVAFLPPFSGG